MIGTVLYRESCQGILNYVFGKECMRILGYGNMYSRDISQKFFGNVLHFQGQRNATKNRYAHITLNLPHGEHLDDVTFHEVSKEYMDTMGYGEQPYVTVRHNDTKHEHVHIVTTNVDGSGKVLGIFNSYRRSMATRRYLEKKFGLSPSPTTKQEMLELLSEQSSENSPKLTASAIFLPMIFPKLYEKMNPVYKKQYEIVALGSYIKNAERTHAPFEKSPKDYIAFFNAKGFYFVKGKEGFEVKSIYTNNKSSYSLPKRTSQYLSSIPDVNATLKEQYPVINSLIEDGRNDLKNLWAGNLMERGMYDKVAFILMAEKVYPNLHWEMVHHHMDNGLRESMTAASTRQSSIQQNRLLRKGVYAISSLLGNRGKKSEEMYNGFKDAFSDFTKFKGKGKVMGFSW